jgi:ketosteroid isomerase-like protein
MGSTNVEVVRRAYEAFNREGRDAMLEFLHHEIEWDESELPARRPGVYHRHEGVTRLLNENASLWEDINVVIDEIVEGGNDQVVAMIRVTGKGRNTGVDVELATAQVWTIRAGKAERVRLYLDRQEAMEAAGAAPGSTV